MHACFQQFRQWLQSDGRHFQILSQLSFLTFGLFALGWDQDWLKYGAAFAGSLGAQTLAILFAGQPPSSIKSAFITSLGISLLMKANSPWLFLFAGMFAIGQKFLLRIGGKHLWNPANFGIVIMAALSGEAWISPGQWGSGPLLVFIIGTCGLAVLSNIRRMDTGIAFMITYVVLEYFRTIVYLGWEWDVLFLKVSSGSLWLFALFMITDPMTSPNAGKARIIWSVLIAGVSFYFANFKFLQGAPFWVLFFMTPLTPLFDKMMRAKVFQWISPKTSSIKQPIYNHHMKNILPICIAFIGMLASAIPSHAFCGFYVAKADAKLFNNKSEVILVRDGIHNVITMSSDFQGNLKDFAMVVPVPVTLKRDEIRVVERNIFDVMNDYSAPRLVEYYDQNPCAPEISYELDERAFSGSVMLTSVECVSKTNADFGVHIEAQYEIDEYNVIILSAKESDGLKNWLILNGYKIPETAAAVLDPYIKSNMKFFLVKINLEKIKNRNTEYLRPIQIEFDHAKFMLPLRLGMANSQGSQDMIVYGLTNTGRIECTNYRTVKMPTDRNVPLFINQKFGDFYKAVFERAYNREGRNAVFLEYAWNISAYTAVKCDPCVGNPPVNMDILNAGARWINNGNPNVFFTRLHVRYSRDKFPADLQFQVTPNTEQFQCRYILTHPAYGDLSCDAGQDYLQDLQNRRQREMDEIYAIAGWRPEEGKQYMNEFVPQIKMKAPVKEKNSFFALGEKLSAPSIAFIALVWLMLFAMYRKNTSPRLQD